MRGERQGDMHSIERTADVVIIGGGVMGASIALHLAQRRVGRVLLCERHFTASGPTGRSSALLRRHWTLELYARMATKSLEIYRNFEELTGVPANITWCGMVILVGPEDLEAMTRTIAMLRHIGADAEALDLGSLRKLAPHLNQDGLAGAAYDPTTGYGDPVTVTNAYVAKARELGVSIHQGTAITGLAMHGGQIGGVVTNRGTVEAPIVVNAAGAWAARIAKMAGVELPITPCRVQMAAFKVPPEFGGPDLIVADNIKGFYFRPETGNLLLVGARRAAGSPAPVDPDTNQDRVDERYLVLATELLCQRVPMMEHGVVTGGYASLIDRTPDDHFIVGEVPEVPGFFIAAGFSGHGFKHSPVIGRVMADLICDGETREFDLTPFSLRRFTDGRAPWRGLYRESPL